MMSELNLSREETLDGKYNCTCPGASATMTIAKIMLLQTLDCIRVIFFSTSAEVQVFDNENPDATRRCRVEACEIRHELPLC